MKRILFSLVCLLASMSIAAKLTVSTLSDGTVVLTLNATGDLDAEFSGTDGAATLKSGSVLAGVMTTATSIKVVTATGVTMNTNDIYRLCGEQWGNYQHFTKLTKLDLSEANVTYQADLKNFGNLSSLKIITFPKSTTSIPDATFVENSKCRIEEVTIPDNPSISLTLGSQAFHTTSLKKITIGARTSINVGSLCFQGDTKLTTVDFRYGTSNIVIGDQAFSYTPALANIVLPEGVTEIGAGAFLNSGIQSIRLPNSLKYIRTKAFSGCSQLKTITIPENVLQIETATFENNYNLSDVYVLGTTTKCAEGAFTDNMAYSYRLNSYSDGQQNVSVSGYTIEDGNMKTRTVLHCLSTAYNNYVNDYIKVIGTSAYSTSAYKDHPELNHWVFDAKGNKLPVVHSSYFEGTSGDYAGWKNFMLVDGKLESQIHIDDMRIRDKWYTMCLPFDMTAEQLKSAYGATVEVVEFSGVDITRDETGSKTILLKFKVPVTATKAHHPYMIHPSIHSGNVTGIKTTITGITKQPESAESLSNEKVVITASDGIVYTFMGNYAGGIGLRQYSYYYYSKDDVSQWPNGFYKWTASSGGTWTPYTACVLLNKDNGANSKAAMSFYDETETYTTDIESISVKTPRSQTAFQGKVMTLNGQVIRENASDLQGLPKGIYIVNGNKHIVR